MKDKFKDMVPLSASGLNKEITRFISDVKKDFITYFNLQKNLNDENINQIALINNKLDNLNLKLEGLNSLDNLDNISSKLDKLERLDNIALVSKKLDALDNITEKLEILDTLDKLDNLDKLDAIFEKLEMLEKLDKLEQLDEIQNVNKNLEKLERLNKLEKLARLDDIYTKLESNDASINILTNLQNNIKANVAASKTTTDETLWAEVFNSTIQSCEWLTPMSFSPGRGAMGYPALYTIYRVLEQFKPTKILEFGMGQSTKITCQYAHTFDKISHHIIENDIVWIDFFTKNFTIPNTSQVVLLDYKMQEFKNSAMTRVFADFSTQFADNKFDFIIIDAPLGGDMKQYARIDILSLLPQCLEKDFVILLDDYDRIGEKNTVKEIEDIFFDNKIKFNKCVYSGKKDSLLITSENLNFLTSI